MNGTWTGKNIAWVAGLFEGEGWITYEHRKYKSKTYKYVRVALESTDKDVVDKLYEIVGFGVLDKHERLAKGYKTSWRWTIVKTEHTMAFIYAVYPWLGKRRRAKAIEALTFIRNKKSIDLIEQVAEKLEISYEEAKSFVGGRKAVSA